LRDGVAVDDSALASLVVGGVTGLCRVNLLTGKATLINTFPDCVADIAIPLNQ